MLQRTPRRAASRISRSGSDRLDDHRDAFLREFGRLGLGVGLAFLLGQLAVDGAVILFESCLVAVSITDIRRMRR